MGRWAQLSTGIATVLLAFLLFSTGPAAIAATEPPLGILIAPDDRPPLPLAVANDPANSETRPLGVLIGPGRQTPIQTPLPFARPTTPLTPQATEPVIHTPVPQQSGDRPLGVLIENPINTTVSSPFNVDQKLQSPVPGITAPPPPPTRSIVPVSPNASSVRPLGTLFGATDTETPRPPDAAPARLNHDATQSVPVESVPSAAPLLPKSPATIPAGSDSTPDLPVRFTSDNVSFDREKNLVTASGNVEVTYGERSLRADKVLYDQNSDVVSAVGNVLLQDPSGERLFGDRMDLTGDMRDALIHNIGLILQDKSRIAGTSAKRTDGKVIKLRKAVYSPCKLCEDNPDAPPFWQIKAVEVIHDKDQQIVEYRDAWVEFFGYPAFYTPYFRHPDPTIDRKSGFLFPSIGSSSDFGTIVETPYFWAISEHEDLTVHPIVMTSEAPVLAGQYRKRFLKGEINAEASITDDTGDQFSTDKGSLGVRGHVIGDGRFIINRTWRWGFDLERASDDTYIRRYGFGSPASLDSQVFVEGFRNQNYFSAKALAFQGLQESDDQDTTPIVLPLVDYNYTGKPDRLGGRTLFDFNFLALTRAEGTDTRRLALHPKWERAFQDTIGGQYKFTTGINADFYHTNGLVRDSDSSKFSGFSHRLFPFANLQWQMPFVKTQGTTQQVIEPVVSAGLAPNGGNSDDIPNEDSTDFEFDETNLFSINRFSGFDRVEGGARVNYGLKWGLFGSQGGSTTAFIGQTYRPRTDSTFGSGSGLEDNFSDIVTSVSVSPGSFLDVLYRARLDVDNFSPSRNEISLSAGVPAFKVDAQYTFLETQQDSEFDGREELNLSASSKINRFWRTSVNAVRDLEGSEMRSVSFDATYENECVVITSRISRTFFEDRDLKPTDSITFHLILKTLGEVKGSSNISSN